MANIILAALYFNGSSTINLKCSSISGHLGSTFLPFKLVIIVFAMVESDCARSNAIVRQTALGSLRAGWPRLKKKLAPSCPLSLNFETKLEAMVDLPAPGLPLIQRMLGARKSTSQLSIFPNVALRVPSMQGGT